MAAVLLLAAVAFASGRSPRPVIAYTQRRTLAHTELYVTGAGGARQVGNGQNPSVAPDGRMVSSSALGSIGPALTLYATAGRRLHSFFNDRVIAVPLAWSPDSRYLVVLLGADPPRITSSWLAVVDTRTMTARTVATGIIRGASFAPSGPDRLVYGYEASSAQVQDPVVNLYTVNPNGSDRAQLTTDGKSLQPLWTARGIVCDRATTRGAGRSPAFQLWLLHGGQSRQLTSRAVVEIVPRAASANGNRLIADYAGPGVNRPLAIQLSPRWVRALATGGRTVQGAGISRDGRTLLLERGPSARLPPYEGVVETVPFGGGQPTRIASGSSAAWNG